MKENKFRVAIARLRCSSHTLAIERRRYERPNPPIEQRVCILCKHMVEDEIHFVTQCIINQDERAILEAKISAVYPDFRYLNNYQRFMFLLQNHDGKILNWFGKFLYNSFNSRNRNLRRIIADRIDIYFMSHIHIRTMVVDSLCTCNHSA